VFRAIIAHHVVILAVAGAALALLAVAWLVRRTARRRSAAGCLWWRRGQRTANLTHWQCRTCRVVACGIRRRLPQECKRYLRPASL
jgi:hypothetical protein